MQVPYRLEVLGAFETSLMQPVLIGRGAVLLTLLGTAAGVDVAPGISALATDRRA